ncbi:MAG: hypothetical protein ABSB78_12455 [Bacteroidota bacterium]
MIVLISDVHLTDESTARNVHRSAFEILEDEIISNVESKKDINEIKVVLLGDIFDLVRTDYWLRKNIAPADRPWNGIINPSTGMNGNKEKVEDQFNKILEGIFDTDACKSFFAMLNNVAKRAKKYNVRDTSVTYVVGNHDRAFNNFESLKNKVKEKLGNVVEIEFVSVLHDPEYSVLARHGCEWDNDCYSWKFSNNVFKTSYNQFDEPVYRIMSLGEVITAELMAGIVYHVSQALANNPSEQDKQFIETIKEVNNLRPMVEVFRYLDWLTKNGMNKYDDILRQALRKALEATYTSSLAILWKRYDNTIPGLLKRTNILVKKGFGFVKTVVLLLHAIYKVWEGIRSIFVGTEDDLVSGAREEWKNNSFENIQYIFYGHTHEARQDYIEGKQDGTVKLYVNTGTYLPLIQECSRDNGYSTAYQMTMAFVYKGSEDHDGKKGDAPSLDIWNGIKRKIYV